MVGKFDCFRVEYAICRLQFCTATAEILSPPARYSSWKLENLFFDLPVHLNIIALPRRHGRERKDPTETLTAPVITYITREIIYVKSNVYVRVSHVRAYNKGCALRRSRLIQVAVASELAESFALPRAGAYPTPIKY